MLTETKREELIDKLAQNDVDSMDLDDMCAAIYDGSVKHYNTLSDEAIIQLSLDYLNLDDEDYLSLDAEPNS
jgi:hypothetical protein